MRIFKHKRFHQWALSENLVDNFLKQALLEMQRGLYEANLGSGLYKKRIAMNGKGKSGGYRTLVACHWGEKAFFIYGFSKSVRSNISENETKVYRKIAKNLINLNINAIEKLLKNGEFFEVK